jgi:hypothetical protein
MRRRMRTDRFVKSAVRDHGKGNDGAIEPGFSIVSVAVAGGRLRGENQRQPGSQMAGLFTSLKFSKITW